MRLRPMTRTIQVPRAAGVPGFLRVVQRALEVPRLRSLQIDHQGRVTYEALVPEGAQDLPVVDVELASLLPSQLIRTIETVEYLPDEGSLAVDQVVGTIRRLLSTGLFPSRWVCADMRVVQKWSGLMTSLEDGDLLGFPVEEDSALPRESLVLFGAVVRGASLVDSSLAVVLSMGVSDGQ